MSSEADQDWKKKLGFTINFESDDDFDTSDVVMRHPVKSSRFLLADNGDGAEADILGTTPPRTKIRDKGKRRSLYDGDFALKLGKDKRLSDTSSDHPNTPERRRRGCVSKLGRMLARDYKQEMGERDSRADSLPSPNVAPAVPSLVSLVDTCSRFMSLTSSRLKCREAQKPCEDVEGRREEEVPPSRVHFHDTFSMLINMGNVDKGCRRTISREEQVWQNELKDLIWLELQAKVAGRTLAQQDAYLCAQRDGVPKLLQAIMEYKFVNPSPCKANSNRGSLTESIRSDASEGFDDSFSDNENESRGCISLDCVSCARAVSRAAQELGGLLERYHAALSLYPSGSALVADQPVAASARFDDRIKAMCLWYNTALHVRLKMLAVRRMLRSLQCRRSEREDPLSRQSSDSSRPCQVRFNICTNPSDSNDSDGSTRSQKDDKNDDSKPNDYANGDSMANDVSIDDDSKANDDPKPNYDDTDDDSKAEDDSKRIYDDANDDPKAEDGNNVKTETNDGNPQDESEHEETYREVYEAEVREADNETEDKGDNQEDETEANTKKKDADEVDSASDRYDTELSTPEIVISEKDSKYSTVDSSASGESGYASEADVGADALRDLTRLRLLDKCSVSPYRIYHDEILKTQGVRRCMMFVNKMRSHVLHRVFLTIEKPDSDPPTPRTEQEAGVFEEAREDEREDEPERHEQDELKRYGCWSAESLSMCLPSYRNHLLLLSCICLEAVHDYLAMRLEDRPEKPSCLTVKQLIHDLREGLDIGADMRFSFVRNVQAAVTGWGADRRARSDLQLVLHTYDTTLDTVLQQYLSYLTTMSVTEQLGRSCLQAEWAFVARLARRVAAVAARAPAAFCDITCNQIDRLKIQFREKFNMLRDFGKKTPESKRQEVYQLCRSVQTIFTSEREAILQTAQWSRALAARLAPKHHRERNRLLNSLMELRDCIVEHTEKTLEHSRTDSSQLAFLVTDGIVSRVRELLLQVYRLGFEIHKELHRFVNEQVSGRASQRIDAVSLSPAKERRTFARSQSIVEDFENNDGDDSLFRHLEEGYNKTVPSTVPAPEDASTAAELQRGWQRRVALAVVAFAECWMHFVLKRCERGRGLRPRWASQGLEFLMLACDPCNTKHLTDAKFEELKTLMDSCISHVIGSRSAPRQNSDSQPRHTHRMQSPLPNGGVSPQPTTTDPEYQHIKQHIGKLYDHSHRVAKATKALDLARDQQLREMKAVGRVLEASVTSYEPKLRQLTFKWQRGLKIGAGSFGKVYTVVNTESGQVLAMKEISVGAGDRRGVQRAANELRVLEGVIHPHLVRYYGCELHREELLLFMELCVEGALDTLVASTGALAEHTTRRYTRQLLSAVRELHARGIVHRDIKSGNIFLTNDGHCLKLGDFGCAVKIRANTTAHGELQGFVGTQAYMAPEVFMNSKTSGHGRAADIWSVGCVVTEMASGKRPFSEYDSNYQIMFVVGMGGRPAVPAALSAEGAAFCRACLTHDPATRPRAAQLLNHHFLMVKSDDDCKCEAGFLL